MARTDMDSRLRGNDGRRLDIAAVVCGDSHTTTAQE